MFISACYPNVGRRLSNRPSKELLSLLSSFSLQEEFHGGCGIAVGTSWDPEWPRTLPFFDRSLSLPPSPGISLLAPFYQLYHNKSDTPSASPG